jgi:hypothetical protein
LKDNGFADQPLRIPPRANPERKTNSPQIVGEISGTLFPQCSQIFEREDGQFQIGHADDAPCFPTRAFALRVAAGHPPVPAQSAPKFRRINIREVRHVATA